MSQIINEAVPELINHLFQIDENNNFKQRFQSFLGAVSEGLLSDGGFTSRLNKLKPRAADFTGSKFGTKNIFHLSE